MTDSGALTTFLLSAGLLAYAYLVYPLLAWLLQRVFYAPVRKKPVAPELTVLVTAYNEEETIGAKIENLLGLDYPDGKLRIVIASDGSTDRTARIAGEYADRGVTVYDFPGRRGKAQVLNDVVPRLETDLVVLADARQRLAENALRELAANFADERVGAASGLLVLGHEGRGGIAEGMGFYWRYETFVRACESAIHSTVGATGALLAFRRALWRGLPEKTVVDDMVLPFQVVRQGFRVVLERGALVHDRASESWDREFVRKTRTLGGNFQVLFHMPTMGLPLLSPITFQFFSHKVARLLGPLALLGLFWSSTWLYRLGGTDGLGTLAGAALLGQALVYLAGALGLASERLGVKLPLVHIPYGFLLTQVAIVCGFLRFTSGRDEFMWERTLQARGESPYGHVLRLFLDSTLFCLGIVAAFYLRHGGAPPEGSLDFFAGLNPAFDLGGLRLSVPLVILVPLSVFYFFRLHERRTEEVDPEFILSILSGVFYGTLVVMLLVYAMRGTLTTVRDGQVAGFPTAVLLISFALNAVVIAGWRLAWKALHARALSAEGAWTSLMVVGRRRIDHRVLADLERDASLPARFAGKIAPEEVESFAGTAPGARRLADQLLLTAGDLRRGEALMAVEVSDRARRASAILPGDFELLVGPSQLRLVRYIPVLSPFPDEPAETVRALKRGIDLLGGAALLLLGAPGMLGYCLTAGPRFRRLRRRGRRGRSFPVRHPARLDPRSWRRRGALRFLCGVSVLLGDQSLLGPPALSDRAYARGGALERAFLLYRPGLVGPRRLFLSGEPRLRRAFLPAILYARNRATTIDLNILMQWLRRDLRRRG